MAREDLDSDGAAAILREQSYPLSAQILSEVERDALAARKLRRGRDHRPRTHRTDECSVSRRSLSRRPLDKDVAGEFLRDIPHQPLFGMKTRIGHEENPRGTSAKLHNHCLVVRHRAEHVPRWVENLQARLSTERNPISRAMQRFGYSEPEKFCMQTTAAR